MENKIYTKKARKLRQNTQKIANFLRYYSKIHSKLPIFRVKSVKFTPAKKNLHEYIHGVRDKYQVCNHDEHDVHGEYEDQLIMMT